MRIHPSFRIVALAEPPDLTTASGQWLNAEMLSNFLFHHMTPLPSADEVKVIDSLAKHHVSETLFDLSDHLRRSRDPNVSLSCIKFVKICEESFVAVPQYKLAIGVMVCGEYGYPWNIHRVVCIVIDSKIDLYLFLFFNKGNQTFSLSIAHLTCNSKIQVLCKRIFLNIHCLL